MSGGSGETPVVLPGILIPSDATGISDIMDTEGAPELSRASAEHELTLESDQAWWLQLLERSTPVVAFAILVCSFCLGIAALVLFIALPIYLLAEDPARVRRAGGILKTTLGFILASGAGVIGTLGFRP
jgi:hypothetical protein